MEFPPSAPRSGLGRDALVAFLLALALGAAWTFRDWANLSALRLPDTDDIMRLQQVRDWLGGQGWADLTQHRLGAGVPLHWTRLADLAPAGLIAGLTPLAGRHAAEVAAVIVWPLALFGIALFLAARIARTLGSELAATAAIVAAVAYPATTIFAPGRIDHHGLQAVLLLWAVLATLRRCGEGSGFALGLLAAASLVVGLETMPLIALLGVAAVAEWAWSGRGERLAGLGVGALAGLAIGRGLFAPVAWAYPACDGFTALAWQAALPVATAPLALVAGGLVARDRIARFGQAAALGGAALTLALWLSPACLHPYGAVDPLLVQLWLSQVGEARPLFAADAATALGYAGVMVAGLAATLWQFKVTQARRWATLALVLVGALALTMVQLRGAYAGALFAAPGLAAAIAAARARGALPLVGAWVASAGMLYPIAAEALIPSPSPMASGGDCAAPALLARLAALTPGTVIAPIDAGAWIIGATPQRAVAAPYHRGGDGDLAVYRLYLGGPAQAVRIAAQWHADYLVACAAMPGRAHTGTAAARLARGPLPGWRVVATFPDGARIDSPR